MRQCGGVCRGAAAAAAAWEGLGSPNIPSKSSPGLTVGRDEMLTSAELPTLFIPRKSAAGEGGVASGWRALPPIC